MSDRSVWCGDRGARVRRNPGSGSMTVVPKSLLRDPDGRHRKHPKNRIGLQAIRHRDIQTNRYGRRRLVCLPTALLINIAAPPSIVLLLPRFSTNSSVRAPTLDAQRSTLAARVFLMLRDCEEQFLVVRGSSWGNANAGLGPSPTTCLVSIAIPGDNNSDARNSRGLLEGGEAGSMSDHSLFALVLPQLLTATGSHHSTFDFGQVVYSALPLHQQQPIPSNRGRAP